MSNLKELYQHPTIKASYSRKTAEDYNVSVFDAGNGKAVQVIQNHDEGMYICDIYIIPQFAGSSIYNIVKSNITTYETDSAEGVTTYIDYVADKYMVEVTSVVDLGEEFND